MGIYIKGMKAPASCSECRMSGWSNYYQLYKCDVCDQAVAKYASEYQMAKPEWCPITEVQEPHGRLIDADRVTAESIKRTGKRLLAIDTASTVIEAEGSED